MVVFMRLSELQENSERRLPPQQRNLTDTETFGKNQTEILRVKATQNETQA